MSIFGTRPEMIKMWGTLKKLDHLNFEHIMVHTGQNYTPELKDFFFKDLKLKTHLTLLQKVSFLQMSLIFLILGPTESY